MARVSNLLVVDDDVGQVILLRNLFKILGLPHECHHVVNGSLALQFLRLQPPYENAPRPQLILLDLNLPGKSGHEVLQEIKLDPVLRSIPVIVLSTSRRTEDIVASYDHHANAFISKPSDLPEAIEVISAIDRFWLETAELPNRKPSG